MFQVSKLISDDFDEGLDPLQLLIDIQASAITDVMTNLQSVHNLDDDVTITFNEEPSAGDLIILDDVIAAHLPTDPSIDSYTTYPRVQKFSQPVYTLIGKIPYKKKWGVMKIKVKSMMSVGATNYSVKIYDPVSTLIIAENTFTNTTIDTVNSLGPVANLPTVDGEIEILAKITSSEPRPEGLIDSIKLIYRMSQQSN